MIDFHRLPLDMFDRLAATDGGPTTVGFLRDTRYSWALLAIRQIMEWRPEVARLVAPLIPAQSLAPQEVIAVLTYPWVCVWLSGVLHKGWTPTDGGRLKAVVGAARLRAGLDDSGAPLTCGAGRPVVLPTLGQLTVAQSRPRPVRREDLDSREFVPLRRSSTVIVDDLDPSRDCHGYPVCTRLATSEWAQWKDRLDSALQILFEHAPERYEEVTTGVVSIAPLLSDSTTVGVSVTHGDAFGGFACSLPTSPAQLAATAVHEFAHSKLHAILALLDLHDESDGRLYFVPWRQDPRPLISALHGVYAFTAVAELWQALRVNRQFEEQATVRFATVRAEVNRVLPNILASPALTVAGQRFVSGLADAVTRLDLHSVPANIERAARRHINWLECRWQAHTGLLS